MKNSKINSFMELIKNSIIVRLFVMGFLILILLIPVSMIESLITEREYRRNSVINEINSKWATQQTISGPILEIPYKVFHEVNYVEDQKVKKRIKEEIKTAYFLPEHLNISGNLLPTTRYRGIYKSIVYTADLKIEGDFSFPDFEKWKIRDENILWDDVIFIFGISDMRGINQNINVKWNDSTLIPKPGLRNKNIFDKGISTKVRLKQNREALNAFSMKLNIRGSSSVNFLPLGRQTAVQLNSEWNSPSFQGAFLPKKRVIDEKGFRATWEIFDFNRDFPQQWTDGKWYLTSSQFGVELFVPVDEYQKTTRSVKYAVLFIALTFLAFFLLIELFSRRRVHPIQYLLVGFALCIFYLLLISLSEHLSFDTAYVISAIAIIALSTFYSRSIAGKMHQVAVMFSIFTGLYGFLYVMLRLEDYSLLMGTLGLFIILAAVMFFTRKFDWYNFKMGKNGSG